MCRVYDLFCLVFFTIIFTLFSLDMVDHIWVPDIYIYNLKSVSNPVLFTKFGGLFVKKDAANGAIKFYYAHELQVKFWCKMRFDRFPFDKQVRNDNYLSKKLG